MSSRAHEPREEFVNQLENRLLADLRRQRLEGGARTWGAWAWLPQSRLATALALVVLMIASMALGGGVVAASYEVQRSEHRDMLVATVEARRIIAQQRLELVNQQLREMLRRVQVGLEQKEYVLEVQARVSEAEAEIKTIMLDLAEIKATGREPMHVVSAPLVSGRDFVTERWQVERTVPVTALSVENRRRSALQANVAVGVGTPTEVDEVATQIAELEVAVEAFDRKLAIRQTFLKGGLPGPIAELRGREAENESRGAGLARRIESVRRRVQAIETRISVGTANPIELAEVKLRLQELELERTKVDYELLLIRKQLGK